MGEPVTTYHSENYTDCYFLKLKVKSYYTYISLLQLPEKLPASVNINSLAEKNSIQPWMNPISVSLVTTQHSLLSPATTSFYTLGQARL